MHERTPGKPSRAASLYTVPEFSEEKLIWPILNWVRLSRPRQCRHIRRRKPAAWPGLSLPDLLVAMAILSVVVLGMMQLYGHIRGQMIRTEAALIAQQRAELAAGYALAAARGASLPAIATVQPMTTGLPAVIIPTAIFVSPMNMAARMRIICKSPGPPRGTGYGMICAPIKDVSPIRSMGCAAIMSNGAGGPEKPR